MALILEALRVNLINVLRVRGSGREPAIVGHNLEATDRCAVTWRTSQFTSDRLASEPGSRHRLRREFFQPGLLLRCRWRIDACVVRCAELGLQFVVVLARVLARARGDLRCQ